MNTKAIDCKNITLRQGDFIMEDMNFAVEQGCITGLVGVNGAGKSTLIELLAGAKVYEAGEVVIQGMVLEDQETEIMEKVAFVFDKPNFSQSVKPDVLAEVMSMMDPSFDMAYYREKMVMLKLDGRKRVKSYSAGMKKKLMLVLALARHPQLLILDEPTSEVDPVSRTVMLDLLQAYMEDEDHTLLFSTHITNDLDKIADYVAFIDEGKILCVEEKENLKDRYRRGNNLQTIEEILCSILA